MSLPENSRKIIHVDMDCFYAAIEIRDNPSLATQPVAVGGAAHQRGVLCTCNYIAREFGVRSAMPTATALRLCPALIVLPVDMAKYKAVAKNIHRIFHEFTDLVEPLALDEAYLDVTDALHYKGSATLAAEAIRAKIRQQEHLCASAGVAPNKFLAKIASGWQKPDGLFVIKPAEVAAFVAELPVTQLFGVGKVTAEKLTRLQIKTCDDLQPWPMGQLQQHFGKMGERLYEQCRGLDSRAVEPHRLRKSLSVETTFSEDVRQFEHCLESLQRLYEQLITRIQTAAPERAMKSQFIKIKFNDFKLATAEIARRELDFQCYLSLFQDVFRKNQKPVRLVGMGVHFQSPEFTPFVQETLF